MSTTQNRLGLTLLETVVVIFLAILVLLIVIAVLLPLYSSGHHPPARRLICQTKIKDIVLACNLYEMKHKRLPPSCHVKEYTTADGATAYNKDGYSFLVDILPEMEWEAVYKTLDINVPLDAENDVLEGNKINRPDDAVGMYNPWLRCPSSKIPPTYPDPDNPERKYAITNYKAVSGTTRRAYEVSSRTDTPPEGLDIYGTGTLRTGSDGVMYPGSRTKLKDITDGTTNTFLIAESEEPLFARWLVGQECGLYTMPEGSAFSPATDEMPYVHPTGYTLNKYGLDSTIPKGRQLTNLNRDYAKSPYPWGENGFRSSRYVLSPTGTRLGPSSGHEGVVMHGFAGGSADSIPTHIDPAAYFFLTTRSNDDPSPAIAEAM